VPVQPAELSARTSAELRRDDTAGSGPGPQEAAADTRAGSRCPDRPVRRHGRDAASGPAGRAAAAVVEAGPGGGCAAPPGPGSYCTGG